MHDVPAPDGVGHGSTHCPRKHSGPKVGPLDDNNVPSAGACALGWANEGRDGGGRVPATASAPSRHCLIARVGREVALPCHQVARHMQRGGHQIQTYDSGVLRKGSEDARPLMVTKIAWFPPAPGGDRHRSITELTAMTHWGDTRRRVAGDRVRTAVSSPSMPSCAGCAHAEKWKSHTICKCKCTIIGPLKRY
jgi:hypothetical protein